MTNHGRSSNVRRKPVLAQWLLGLFLLLAVIASILMIFGDDLSMTATLAVIAALWAAVIGAVLVTRYRRQADVAETRARDLRLVYELQLEREIAARRLYESEVEATIREEVREESNGELEELKLQVLALRSSLEQLVGGPLPEGRVALADLRRRELSAPGAVYETPVYVPADDHVVAERDFASTTGGDDSHRVPRVRDADEADTELTDLIPVVTDEEVDGEFADDAFAGGDEAEVVADEYGADEYGAEEHRADDYGADEYGAVARGAEAGRAEYEETAYTAENYIPPAYDEAGYEDAGYEDTHVDGGGHEPETVEVRPAPDEDDDAGAHSHGRPAAELLSRFQLSGAPRRSRRRE